MRRVVEGNRPHVLCDRIFGPLWYRLLMGTSPITDAYVAAIVNDTLATYALPGFQEFRNTMRAE